MNVVNFLNLEYIYLRIVDFFGALDAVYILNRFIFLLDLLKPIAIILSIFIFFVIIYSHNKLAAMAKEDEAILHEKKRKKAEVEERGADQELNKKWMEVQQHIASDNPSEWRLAILEADIMLGDILEKRGYQGDSIGDKLKSADKSDFLNLDSAWAAHKIRNQIAHEGSDFKLNEREARAVIDLYQKVFAEFYHI